MAQRAPNGYREYDDDDLRLVAEIQTLQGIGFSLDDTRPFVDCLRSGHDSGDACADSLETYRRKLAEVDGVLARLTEVRASIQAKLDVAQARHEGEEGR
jgi:DNA-binding transcriptional MerR regulator